MAFLKAYIVGLLVCFLLSLLTEQFYYGNGRSETVHLKTIFEDFLYSLTSWLGLIGIAILWAGEWYTGFPQKGYGEFLHEYEEELKREAAERKNGDENR